MDALMCDGLVSVMKDAYTAGLETGTVARPAIMPLVRGGAEQPRRFGVAVARMEEDGYCISLTEAFAR
ncbi:hypothetical protein [Streptomyces glaucescens]